MREKSEFMEEMDSGYWRAARFLKKHMRSILFAYKKLEEVSIPWQQDGEAYGGIAKRMKNRDEWSAKAKNLLNLLLRRYAERERYESFIARLAGKGYMVELKSKV